MSNLMVLAKSGHGGDDTEIKWSKKLMWTYSDHCPYIGVLIYHPCTDESCFYCVRNSPNKKTTKSYDLTPVKPTHNPHTIAGSALCAGTMYVHPCIHSQNKHLFCCSKHQFSTGSPFMAPVLWT